MYHLRNAADIHKTDTGSSRPTGAASRPAQSVASSGSASRASGTRLVQPSTATPFVSTEANVEYARRVERARYESRRQTGDIDDDLLDALVDRRRIADEVMRDIAAAASANDIAAGTKVANNSAPRCPQDPRRGDAATSARKPVSAAGTRGQSAGGEMPRRKPSQSRPAKQMRPAASRASRRTETQRAVSAPVDAVGASAASTVAAESTKSASPASPKSDINAVPSRNVETSAKSRRRRIATRALQVTASVGVACALGLGLFDAYSSNGAKAAVGVDIDGVIESMPVDGDGAVEPMGGDALAQASYRTGDEEPLGVADGDGTDLVGTFMRLVELRSAAVGEADAAVEELGDYADADALADAEARMTGATSIDAYDEARDDFDELVDEARGEKETAEEEKRRAEETKLTGDRSKGPILTKSAGVVYYNGHKETYYNLNMSVLINQFASEFGEYNVDDRGFKRLGEYIMVAANLDLYPKGTIVETSAGQGVVVDTGTFAVSNPTQFDLAVTW